MATLVEKGVKWFREKHVQSSRVTIIYRRGTHSVTIADAVQGRSEVGNFIIEDVDGTFKSIDWYIASDDLEIDGVQVEPEIGDEIRHVTYGSTVQVELYVVRPIPGGREFEVVDERLQTATDGKLYRVHSKYVKTES